MFVLGSAGLNRIRIRLPRMLIVHCGHELQGIKPLKRFQSCDPWDTLLKQGVNERRFMGRIKITIRIANRASREKWGDQRDLNPRQPDPQSGALTGLSYGHHPEPSNVCAPFRSVKCI